MRPGVEDCVAVITGASSGIGRATALALAQRGASVVLAARSEESLNEVAGECEAGGGRALVVPTDVADEAAVHELARRASERFGRIDVWLNGAAVMAYGRFEQIPSDVFRQVIETNLFGHIHGARAALPHFREQGEGVLINVGSVWGEISSPYVAPYVVSKFAAHALSECLQQALAADAETRDIRVCTLLPQSVDTPIFHHAANYLGREIKPVMPILPVERVVDAVIGLIERPRPRLTVSWWGRFLQVAYTLAHPLFRTAIPHAMRLTAIGRGSAADDRGNVFEPRPEWNRIEGDWREWERRVVVRTSVGAGAGAALGLALLAALRSALRSSARRPRHGTR